MVADKAVIGHGVNYGSFDFSFGFLLLGLLLLCSDSRILSRSRADSGVFLSLGLKVHEVQFSHSFLHIHQR